LPNHYVGNRHSAVFDEKKGGGIMKHRGKSNLIILEAVMVFIAILFLFPALITLVNSFKTDAEIVLNPVSWPQSFSLRNYYAAWQEMNFPLVLFNTFIITSLSTLSIIIVSSMAAYILVRSRTRISWVLFLTFTFSMVVPFQTIMVPLVQTAKEYGLKNILGIIPIYIGLGCPLAIFMYHGFIKGIPREIDESAAIDGANPLRTFFQLVFPLLKPITATIAILDVLWIWNDFLLPLIILPKQSTLQLAQYGFFSLFKREYSLAMASLVLSASPIILFYLAMQKYIVKGIAAGAVKG
jgi:raffinose/stachyose/melibiose transport system permease protein